MREALGVLRSFWTYRASRRHHRGLVALYRDFVPPGGLAFDIGAHAGDRIRAFRALGARVVALEPQPAMARLLRLLHGRDRGVTLLAAACGRAPGRAEMALNRANPTVSTLSTRFLAATRGAPGWEGQVWDARITVPVVTLDGLVARHGVPDFVKIDVEGHEAEVLAGLSAPVPALSFEILAADRPAARAALARAEALGYRRFRLSLGESHVFATPWLAGGAMAAALEALPEAANSGDVYARP